MSVDRSSRRASALRARSEAAGTIGTRPVGARRDLTERARALVAVAGDTVREELCQPNVVKEFCDTIRYGSSREVMDRTCLNIQAQVYRLLGEERKLVVEFCHSLGVSTEQELRAYVDAARSVEGASEHDTAERVTAYLEKYLDRNPQMRVAIVRRLGGQVPHAEVV